MKTIAVSALFLIGILLVGCTSDSAFTQKGTVTVAGFTNDVFYPLPYATPPNLSFPHTGGNFFKLIEQRTDGFKFTVGGYQPGAAKVQWIAVGQKTKTEK